MVEALSFAFIQRALAAGCLVALVSSYYGAFVVQRRLGFLGSGLAHAAFGGVALGLLLNKEPLVVAVPFTVAIALVITAVRGRTKLSSDTVIGIFFSLAMALGIIFMSLRATYSTDAFAYLFGSILAVTNTDVWAAAGTAAAALLTVPLWGRLAYATFDRDAALADRLPVDLDDYILSALIAVTIVIATKVVGIVLLSAFFIIPAASARLIARKFSTMTLLSAVFGIATVVAGMWASYALDLPSGAMIILVEVGVFILALLFKTVSQRGQASRK